MYNANNQQVKKEYYLAHSTTINKLYTDLGATKQEIIEDKTRQLAGLDRLVFKGSKTFGVQEKYDGYANNNLFLEISVKTKFGTEDGYITKHYDNVNYLAYIYIDYGIAYFYDIKQFAKASKKHVATNKTKETTLYGNTVQYQLISINKTLNKEYGFKKMIKFNCDEIKGILQKDRTI